MRISKQMRTTLFFTTLAGGAMAVAGSCSDTDQACNPFVDPSCADDNGIDLTPTAGGAGSAGTEGDFLPNPGTSPGGGTGGTEEICDVEEIPARIQASNIMLVLDKSGSMSKYRWLDQGVERSRWESLYKTVEFMVGTFNNSVRFGMNLFPSKGAGSQEQACLMNPGIDVPIADNNGVAIMQAMPGPQDSVQGGTPASSGYAQAVDYLTGPAFAGDPRRRIILLVMDGRVADCDESHSDMIRKAELALQSGVTTFVVGIDVDSSTPEGLALSGDLRLLARAGGTETFLDSSDPQKLRDAMAKVVDSVSDCRVPLSKPPLQPDWATVEVSGVVHRWLGAGVPSCEAAALPAGVGGFVYTEVEGQRAVELCGQACSDYIKTGAVKVNLLCEPPK